MPEIFKLEFEKKLFSLVAIQKATYRLSGFFNMDVKTINNSYEITLNKNKQTSDEGFSYAIEEFKKYVNDEQLREKLKQETEPIRNLILGIAFSKTNLKQDE